jgi:hypothetical protein
VPGIGAVLGVIEQRLEERRLDPFQVRLGLPDDVARHELRRVLVHVDEAVQLAQDVVGQVLRGLGLAVHVDRHVQVLAPHQLDEVRRFSTAGSRSGPGVNSSSSIDRMKALARLCCCANCDRSP